MNLPPYCTPEKPFFGLDVPFMRYLGLQPETLGDGYARTRLPAAPDLTNSRAEVHGGTLMSVLDFTMTAAARSHDPLGYGVATIEMSTHFLDKARGELVFEGKVIRLGRSTVFCEGTVTDAAGTTVCVSRGTFKLIPIQR